MVYGITLSKVSELYFLSNVVEQFKVVCEFKEEGLLSEEKNDFIDCLGRPYLYVGDFF